MDPLLPKFVDVFTQPTIMIPSHSINHTIDIIPNTVLPNAPSSNLIHQENGEIENQPDQHLDSIHIQPSTSPSVSITFIIPKRLSIHVASSNISSISTQVVAYSKRLNGSPSHEKKCIAKYSCHQYFSKGIIVGQNLL